ncbi:hydrogenase maturation nickel metallochaperone HypA/HybF [Candidatus Pyrohabitans sp.]
MHELSIAQSIVSAVLSNLKGKGKVLKVQIAIGELTHINEKQLAFAFEIASRGTPVEGAELEMRLIEAELRCVGCGWQGKSFTCKECGSAMEVMAGEELFLERIRVEADEECTV